jgi:uncharacterized protein
MSDVLGSGWAFPVHVDRQTGRVGLAHRAQDIEQAIMMILLTPKGQRMMRPEFGSQLHELIFAPNDATSAGLAAYYVEQALGMWEPRIRVQEVTARPDPQNAACLLIDIRYEIKATHDSRALVFPFYRIPEE